MSEHDYLSSKNVLIIMLIAFMIILISISYFLSTAPRAVEESEPVTVNVNVNVDDGAEATLEDKTIIGKPMNYSEELETAKELIEEVVTINSTGEERIVYVDTTHQTVSAIQECINLRTKNFQSQCDKAEAIGNTTIPIGSGCAENLTLSYCQSVLYND